MKRTNKYLNRAFAVVVLCAATALALPAQTLTTLHSFEGVDGAYPFSTLVEAAGGRLYGTTSSGGGGANSGTIFEIASGAQFTPLYSFSYGQDPTAGLVETGDGTLYGTTHFGGANGFGTVYKITPAGTLTTLYSFCPESKCADGDEPLGGLVQAAGGDLYGTTYFGGTNGYGTIFKITPAGALTTLHSFCSDVQSNCRDGANPEAALVQASKGDFYGTTYNGGANGFANEIAGTVFKITPSGTFATLYNFCSLSGCTDGSGPSAALVEGTDGNFYGTTAEGGSYGDGTVFKITPDGALTTLYSFCSQANCTDGEHPFAALVQGTDGNFYGTAYLGGANGYGTIFNITPSGALTTLHSFDSTDGAYPYAGLLQASNGAFYGTTQNGGANNDGTVFGLSVTLPQ